MRVLQRRNFVIGGYTPAGRNFHAILVGSDEGRVLQYVAKVHGGFTPALRAALFKQFHRLEAKTCPFKNLSNSQNCRLDLSSRCSASRWPRISWTRPLVFRPNAR
jgi:ATP-dependent DNA ligase